jgi:hypothetical protein
MLVSQFSYSEKRHFANCSRKVNHG